MGWDSTNDSRLGTYAGYVYTSDFWSGKEKDCLVGWQAKREIGVIIAKYNYQVSHFGVFHHQHQAPEAPHFSNIEAIYETTAANIMAPVNGGNVL
jgi:hypothetical protein